MYAIVDIAGQQFKVEKDQKLYVHRLDGEEGKKVSFEKVLLIEDGGKIAVGDPVVKGAAVDAKILAHVKGDKVLVFKKKRRKGYQKLNGHRQYFTQIQIETISEKAVKKTAAAGESEAPKAAAAAVKPSAEKATTAKKPAAEKSAAAKKPAAEKSAAAKKPAAEKSATAKKPAATKKPAAKSSPKKGTE